MYPLWDQIKAFMQSISGIVHKQADTLDRTTATLDETTVTANEAHEAALYSRERIDGKMDAANPIGKGAFIMNPLNVNEYGEDSSSLGRGAATGNYAHAEGSLTEAKGNQSHAEGNTTKANGNESHAEGLNTEANGTAGHAEGGYTVSGGRSLDSGFMGASYAHAEGVRTDASGTASHAEGSHTTASLEAAHAEGKGTKARSDYSHAEGYCTEVASKTAIAQHVQGKANIVDAEGKYAHIVGNGEATYNEDGTFTIDKASNAHTLDWDGNAWFQGNVYVGGAGQEDKNASKLIEQKDIGDGLEVVDGKLNAFYRKVELINSFTVMEDVDTLTIDKDADGNPFELKVAIMRIQCGMDVAEGEATGSIRFSAPTDSYFARIYLNNWKYPGYKVTDTYARPSTAAALCDVSRDLTFLDGIYGDEGGAVATNHYSFSKDSLAYAPDTVIVRAGTDFKVPKNAKVWLYGVRRIGV